jgi:lysine 2,3-aminomutase
VSKGIEIIEGLRGHTSGYAIPQYVIDAPGGGGKVPINPDYVFFHDREKVVFRNFEGQVFEYPEAQEKEHREITPLLPLPESVLDGVLNTASRS